MATKLGSIFIELKLDSKEYRASLRRQKADALKTAQEIEKGQLDASKKANDQRLKTARSYLEADASAQFAQRKQIEKQAIESNKRLIKNEEELRNKRTAMMKQQFLSSSAIVTRGLDQIKQLGGSPFANVQKQLSKTTKSIEQSNKRIRNNLQQSMNQFKQFSNIAPFANVQRQMRGTQRSMEQLGRTNRQTQKSFLELTMGILKSAPAFAVATAAIAAVYQAIRILRDELIGGFKAVEEFRINVISMSAFITTFSERAKEGDIAGAYQEASFYSGELIKKLEIIDALTIANAADLRIITESFIKQGVLLDINNEKQVKGFVNITNALKLLTKGQNQSIQLRQEVRSLVSGQLKDTNVLVKTLQAIDPQIKSHLKTWKEQGVLIERVGDLLVGFGPAASDFQKTFAAAGTTMQTIHDKILRGAFAPFFDMLIKRVVTFNKSLMSSDGTLTDLGRTIQDKISKHLAQLEKIILGIWKVIVKIYENWELIVSITKVYINLWVASKIIDFFIKMRKQIMALNVAQIAFNISTRANPYILAATGLLVAGNWLRDKINDIKEATEAQKKLNEEAGKYVEINETAIGNRSFADAVRGEGGFAQPNLKSLHFPTLFMGASHGGVNAPKLSKDNEEALKKLREDRNEALEKLGLLDEEAFQRQRFLIMQEADLIAKHLGGNIEAFERAAKFEKEKIDELNEAREKLLNPDRIREITPRNVKIKGLGKDPLDPDALDTKAFLRDLKIKERAEKELNDKRARAADEVNDLRKKLREEDLINHGTYLDGLKGGIDSYIEETGSLYENVVEATDAAFSKMEDILVDFAMTGKFAFEDFANSVIADITRIYIRQAVLGPIAQAIGGLPIFQNAHGNAFVNGRVQAFASGGIVDSPTFFGTKSGPAVAGEAGTEAILPLKRNKSGDLGVSTSGKGGGDQMIVEYKPVIQAIDTQSGLQFLARHSGVITGLVNQAYNKRGRSL